MASLSYFELTDARVFLCGSCSSVWRKRLLLRHTGAMDAGRAHLCEYLVQPLQRAVEMQLYPTGGAGHCLTSAGCRGRERKQFVSLSSTKYQTNKKKKPLLIKLALKAAVLSGTAVELAPTVKLTLQVISEGIQLSVRDVFLQGVWCQKHNTHHSKSSGNPLCKACLKWFHLPHHVPLATACLLHSSSVTQTSLADSQLHSLPHHPLFLL